MDETMRGKCRRCNHYRAFRNYYFCEVGEDSTARCLRENGSWFMPRNSMFDIPQIQVMEVVEEAPPEEPSA